MTGLTTPKQPFVKRTFTKIAVVVHTQALVATNSRDGSLADELMPTGA